MNFIFMEILTISYTYIWNLYPKNIIVFCPKKYGNKEKKRQTVKSEYAHKHNSYVEFTYHYYCNEYWALSHYDSLCICYLELFIFSFIFWIYTFFYSINIEYILLKLQWVKILDSFKFAWINVLLYNKYQTGYKLCIILIQFEVRQLWWTFTEWRVTIQVKLFINLLEIILIYIF